MSFMVKVNILQLLTVYVLHFIRNDKTLHLLSSFYYWECSSGSGHGYQICILWIYNEYEEYVQFVLISMDKVHMGHMCMLVFEMHFSYDMFHIWNTLDCIFRCLEVFCSFLGTTIWAK